MFQHLIIIIADVELSPLIYDLCYQELGDDCTNIDEIVKIICTSVEVHPLSLGAMLSH